jgi:predicted nuclease of restriction endonuclease-like (RecB) superfamily
MAKPSFLATSDNYRSLLEGLKDRIRSSQLKAAIAVNQEMILLYWHIGREILARQQEQGWGTKVITQLSKDLKREFPEMTGFSARNLGYMKAFAEAWPDEAILHQLGAKIPWKHNCILIEKVKDPLKRRWYAQETVNNGWSRSILTAQIETNLYEREGSPATNFERTLPPAQSDLAHQVLKDPYHLDFLTLAKDVQEQELERALVKHMRDFLLELGVGFSFVGHHYHLNIGGEDFYLDMLFYHLELRCFVIIELEMEDFRPEYSGLMNLYISAVDDQKRKEMDRPTIGIILCKTKNKTIAEYAIRNLSNPIAVVTHQLPQDLREELPSTEQLQAEFENAIQLVGGQDPDTAASEDD